MTDSGKRRRVHNQIFIYFQNINGWKNKSTRIKAIYRKYDPDIILLADIGIAANDPSLKFFPFKQHAINTVNEHSGVAIYIKTYIKYSLINHKFISDTIAIKID